MVSILNVQRLRCSSLLAAIFIASVAAAAHIPPQETLIPSGAARGAAGLAAVSSSRGVVLASPANVERATT